MLLRVASGVRAGRWCPSDLLSGGHRHGSHGGRLEPLLELGPHLVDLEAEGDVDGDHVGVDLGVAGLDVARSGNARRAAAAARTSRPSRGDGPRWSGWTRVPYWSTWSECRRCRHRCVGVRRPRRSPCSATAATEVRPACGARVHGPSRSVDGVLPDLELEVTVRRLDASRLSARRTTRAARRGPARRRCGSRSRRGAARPRPPAGPRAPRSTGSARRRSISVFARV